MIQLTGGFGDYGIPLGKDNQDFGFNYLITDGKALLLKSKIENFKVFALKALNDTLITQKYKVLLDTSDKDEPCQNTSNFISWEERSSKHMPLAAVLANLSIYKSYVEKLRDEVVINEAKKEVY